MRSHIKRVDSEHASAGLDGLDRISSADRSRIMSQIRDKDTKPEMIVRRLLHRMGYRFRTHRRDLPGRPDVVLPKHRKVVFVHGCFWHRHRCTRGRSMPSTRTEFWRMKFEGNRERDLKARNHLRKLGWKVVVVWECQTRDVQLLQRRLHQFLSDSRS